MSDISGEAVDIVVIAQEDGVRITSRVAEGEPYTGELNTGEAFVIRYPSRAYWYKISGRAEVVTRFGTHQVDDNQ